MMERDARWILTGGHWYWLQAIYWCPAAECEKGFSDGKHYCEYTLWAREQSSPTKVEIVKDVSKLRERGGITEPALGGGQGPEMVATQHPTTTSTTSDGNLSRSGLNTTGNPQELVTT